MNSKGDFFQGILLILVLLTQTHAYSERQMVLQKQIVDLMETIRGQTIAMLTNPTSVDGQMRPLFDRIIELSSKYRVTIKCFFAPQHGLRGDHQDGKGDDDYIDPTTGIQVYTLYGARIKPTSSQLQGVDTLVYDIQDVGARYYTFIWTLTYSIEVCAQAGVEVVVFDRPNPLGRRVEGCPMKVEGGLVGRILPGQPYGITQRYGLTIGELIGYLRLWLPSFKYTVIKMSKLYEMDERDWVMSSPNMPTLGTVGVYAGLGLVQGTSVSEGRGTTKPFQLTGNPKVNAKDIIQYFSQRAAETGYGNTFKLRETYFIPTFSKHQGEICGGVELVVIDPSKFEVVRVAMHTLKAYNAAIKDGSMRFSSGLDRLFGVLGFFDRIQVKSVEEILGDCANERKMYEEGAKKAWLYDVTTGEQIHNSTVGYLTS